MDILKFFTAGSVDDGKSTLIGRLLYDTNSILADQLEALQASNRKNDDGTIDLAILTDGLRAEREQGITIDVAYKYFQTEKRKFIIADTPGHIQYTRNMVTGASTAKLAIILIDARKGVVEQTVRHSYLVSLLGIAELAVCINKMDMVDFSAEVYEEITAAYRSLALQLNLKKVTFIPVSALKGDNIVHRSVHMPWYQGPALLDFLEGVEVAGHLPSVYARMPVQWVIRPQTADLPDYRGYAGRMLSGTFSPGDPVTVMPSGQQSIIDRIEAFDRQPAQALTGMSVTLHLKDQVDISRGDVLVSSAYLTRQTRSIAADLCWMDQKQLDQGLTYLLQHNSKTTKCKIAGIAYKVDINTLEKGDAESFQLNDIGRVSLRTADELALDWYDENPANGAAILIDSRTNLTVAALMFRESV